MGGGNQLIRKKGESKKDGNTATLVQPRVTKMTRESKNAERKGDYRGSERPCGKSFDYNWRDN